MATHVLGDDKDYLVFNSTKAYPLTSTLVNFWTSCDVMTQSGGDKRIADLFTKGSHHQNLSVIYVVQNIFQQGRETRNISLHAHYIVLSKSPWDKQ